MKHLKSITLVGTGNVAYNMLHAFPLDGIRINEVKGRSEKALHNIARQFNVPVSQDISNFNNQSDLLILAVTDDAIEAVARQLQPSLVPVVHTAGSVSIDVFNGMGFAACGVFYPLQTFSKSRMVDFSEVPLYVEASTPEFEKQLVELAKSLSSHVDVVSSEQRAILHIAGVFGCNFSNHMMAIAQRLTSENNLDFNALVPLVKETLEKAIIMGPAAAQTGPAIRENQQVLKKHEEMLQDEPLLKEIYRLLSYSIQKFQIR